MKCTRIGVFVAALSAGFAIRAAASELDPLARFIGSWNAKGTWDDPSKGGMRVENEWGLGGRILKEKSIVVGDKGDDLVCETVYSWHPGKKTLVFQTFSTWGELFDGEIQCKGDVYELTWTGYGAEKTTPYRSETRFTDADTFVETVFRKNGDKWEQLKQSTFRRSVGGDAGAAKAAFERLKKLAGTWEGTAGDESSFPASVEYRLCSAGNVVMETLFPRTDHEMISMYFLADGALVMTHYCAMGNQPHMRFDARQSKPDMLVFAFDGGTNFDPKKDPHIHCGQIRIVGDDRLESQWEHWGSGREAGSKVFSLTRKGR